jgi:hypothetical protein
MERSAEPTEAQWLKFCPKSSSSACEALEDSCFVYKVGQREVKPKLKPTLAFTISTYQKKKKNPKQATNKQKNPGGPQKSRGERNLTQNLDETGLGLSC